MKWKIRKGKFPPHLPDNEKFMFEELDLKYKDGDPELKDELEKLGLVEWVTYPGIYNNFKELPSLSETGRRKYEIFCGGFLYYHDVEFKKYPQGTGGCPEWKEYPTKDFEHKIYFEWFSEEKGGKKDKIRIYISFTPPEYNVDPPKPPAPPPPES
ncbi:hypothetical protein [Terrimonas alba]|uniref:hypothetical protein n=1 Tax=Terrimonas alba TaxID=3349636 RepID=UPI0035F359D5